jgi:hypothetical protein
MNGARIGGFAVAGGAVALLGAGWAMALNAGLLLVSAALVAGVRPPASDGAVELAVTGSMAAGRAADAPEPSGPRANMMRDLRDGWQEFRSRQWLWVVVLQYSFVLMVFHAVWGVLGPVVANDRLGGAKGWSWVLAAESVGMLVGVIFAIRARPRRSIRLVVLLTFPLASLPLALGLGAPVYLAAVAAFVGGVAIDVLLVIWDTTMQREIPKESLSRVSSYDALGSLMLGPVGLLLAGPSVAAIGVDGALLGSAAVMVLASAGALCSPGVRALRWSAPVVAGRPGTSARGERPDARASRIAQLDHDEPRGRTQELTGQAPAALAEA